MDISRIAGMAALGFWGPPRPNPRELAVQAALLRDIVGNPFRPLRLDRDWRTESVVAIARFVYDKTDFADLPVLADALEEAGCTTQDLLGHCRLPGEHVRGCWLVDMLLDRR